MFASIAADAQRVRTAPAKRTPASGASAPSEPARTGIERDTFADVLAHAAPAAPDAGLSAQLASSPFAPAFRHVLPLAAAATFDVRALFSDSLAATYLAGLLAPATRELAISAREPAWLPAAIASFAAVGGGPAAFEPGAVARGALDEQAMGAIARGALDEQTAGAVARGALDWQPTYVAPSEPAGGTATDTAASEPAEQRLAPSEPTEQRAAPSEPAEQRLAPSEQRLASSEQLTTVRSALLAWDVETSLAGTASVGAPAVSVGPSVARSMALAMALPMIGELATVRDAVGSVDAAGVPIPGASYAAPGMIADRAHAWSVAQERSSSDLAFDFVTPELVLAARVYGLGPAEAAQAARLAVAGPGHLAAMASSVDRTFVQALAIEAERRDHVQAITAYPRSGAGAAATAAAPSGAPQDATPAAAGGATPMGHPYAAGSTFGVQRRAPRGAFMWPPATVAALGLSAASPDGEQSMSVAALELLAAQSVAALGTYAALGVDPGTGMELEPRMGSAPADAAGVSAPEAPAQRGPGTAEPPEPAVVATAIARVPMSRRSKFEAMYVALGQSHVARGWSPAARAARALALAGRGDESITAQERAMIAWEVLPVVAPAAASHPDAMGAIDFDLAPGASRSTGGDAQRARRAEQLQIALPDYVEARPGLSALTARAGEALGSYVAPSAAPVSASSPTSSAASTRDGGAVRRVPTAAQEMVRTGRPTGRFGGGEVEIPTWFEVAARKMFEQQSGDPASDLSLTELTLVTAAPPSQVAASTRGMPSSLVSPNPSSGSQNAHAGIANALKIEKHAQDCHRQILDIMDAARNRNGDPYL